MCKKKTMLALALLGLLGTAPLLGACNTMHGLGQDISQTGDSLEKSSDSNK
jgi:predicted small secreted protein